MTGTRTFVPFGPAPAAAGERLLTVTGEALAQLARIAAAEADGGPVTLRVAVVGGGCSGLSYSMELAPPRPGDHVERHGDLLVAVDPSAVGHLRGVTLHFDGGLGGRGFTFTNPNARRTCGCGDSFAV